MLQKIIITISFGLVLTSSAAQIKWPAVTQQTKPWTRWWWEGSAVNKKDLTWNLQQYKAVGLGGVELTPIYGVQGQEKRFINFLSPQWMDVFKHTLTEAKRLNLGVDVANGTGWPFGGPWVTDEDASKTVYSKTYFLNTGETLNEPVEYKQEAFVRTANNKAAAVDSILQPLSANKNLQALALDQVLFPQKLPLQLLMAYSDRGQAIDLTAKVDANGKLAWTAPSGKWNLYALFVGLHGKMVERAAPGGEGYAIDHFSLSAAKNYFKKFDEAFKGHDLSYLRGFFNDSYEVDDARGQANWTSDLFAQFQKRRGYDLRNYLHALFGKDSNDTKVRVVYDYRATIDELLLEYFTQTWSKWGKTKGALIRNQSHGSPANTLDLYSAVDIPETEGTDILRFKFASSATNVTGKKLASSESATWLDEHFLSSWGSVKKAVDLFFLGGVNHIFDHGTEYSPKDALWPGWLFYAAVHFQPTNPQWKDFGVLNDYITRVQSFLQAGKPDNDVLVYYPIIDRYSEPGRELLQHFDGMERNFVGTDFEHLSKWMIENGYSFDFFSDRQLQNISFSNGKLVSGGNNHQTILLPANKFITEKSFQKLVALAMSGATILFYKNLPLDVPGLGGLEEKRKLFKQQLAQLNFADVGGLKKATVGNGAFYTGDDVQNLLNAAKTRREQLVKKGLSSIQRKTNEGQTYFINNRTDNVVDEWVPLSSRAVSVALFDPMSGKNGLARWRNTGNGIEVYLQLQPFESVIVQTYTNKKSGAQYAYLNPAGEVNEITGEWDIEFLSGGPVIPKKIKTDRLQSWTEFDEEEVKNFSGTARYSINFQKPGGSGTSWLLDLGKVNETAEVFLNGKKMSTLIGPSFRLIIPSSLFKANNRLEIVVANLMANRISYMDRNNIPWKIFYNTNMPARRRENTKNGLFDASEWKPLPSGLSGPVTITPLKSML